MIKRRKHEHKTDYKARLNLLKGGNYRIIFRKSNRYVRGQFVESRAAQDFVLRQAESRELIKLGWPKDFLGSMKSLPACYLTGLLLGKRIMDKYGKQALALDIGLIRNKAMSRIYAFAKGVIDSGIDLKVSKDVLPSEERIKGRHIKKDIAGFLDKVSKAVENE